MRVLFICKERHLYGEQANDKSRSFGLVNSAELVCKALELQGIECKVSVLVDANAIDREVYHYRPDIVIIEALWVTADKLSELMRLHPKRMFIVRIHSKISFLAYEGIAIEWLKEYAELTRDLNLRIASNNADTYKVLSHILDGEDVLYLPNIYLIQGDVSLFDVIKENIVCKHPVLKRLYKHNEVDIGCFGSIRPMKNTLIQAIAAIAFANNRGLKLNFHINNKAEQLGDRIFKNLYHLFKDSNHELVVHDWYDHRNFIKVVRKMDYGMQVSFSETFNIVTADFVNNDVPIVVSDEIGYLPDYNYAKPNSVRSIVEVLDFFEDYRDVVTTNNKYKLKKFSEDATEQWLDILHKIEHIMKHFRPKPHHSHHPHR